MTRKLLFLLTVLLFAGAAVSIPQDASARALGKNEKKRIECARFKMMVLAEFFDVRVPADKKVYKFPEVCGERLAGKEIKPPKWFIEGETVKTKGQDGQEVTQTREAEISRLDKNKVVYVPNEGTYSEADLWRQAFANVYLFLDRADQSLDPSQPLVLEQLSRGYVGNRINLIATLDRLNKDLPRGNRVIVMKDSLQGRGRALLATFELINSEFFSTIESFSSPLSQRENKYRQSVMGVVVLANQLYSQFMTKPIPMNPPDPRLLKDTRADKAMSLLLKLLGSFFVFYAVYLLIGNKKQDILTMMEKYRAKSLVWAEDFNRQFVTIDIKYIVFGTIGLFALGGLMFGLMIGGFTGVFVFLMAVAFGAFVSIRMPMAVLEMLKKSRGRKVNAQLMDALILLSNSLRSGMDIVQGFELVSHDMQPPIADEFGLVVKNYQLGTPFEKALEGMSDRVDSRMLVYIIKAIIIQRQVGGNLTLIFARLVENIREESKLEEKLQAMTAQQRIQAIVVGLMPFVMMAVMFLFNSSEMIAFYTSAVGLIVFFGCMVWIMIGMQLIKKVGEVRV